MFPLSSATIYLIVSMCAFHVLCFASSMLTPRCVYTESYMVASVGGFLNFDSSFLSSTDSSLNATAQKGLLLELIEFH